MRSRSIQILHNRSRMSIQIWCSIMRKENPITKHTHNSRQLLTLRNQITQPRRQNHQQNLNLSNSFLQLRFLKLNHKRRAQRKHKPNEKRSKNTLDKIIARNNRVFLVRKIRVRPIDNRSVHHHRNHIVQDRFSKHKAEQIIISVEVVEHCEHCYGVSGANEGSECPTFFKG